MQRIYLKAQWWPFIGYPDPGDTGLLVQRQVRRRIEDFAWTI